MNASSNGWTCDLGAVSGPDACDRCAHKCEGRALYAGPHSDQSELPKLLVIDHHTGISPLVVAFVTWLVA